MSKGYEIERLRNEMERALTLIEDKLNATNIVIIQVKKELSNSGVGGDSKQCAINIALALLDGHNLECAENMCEDTITACTCNTNS